MAKFEVKLSRTVYVTADDISTAILEAGKRHPGMTVEDVHMDGRQMHQTLSDATGNTIWYRPGCVHDPDEVCIYDPVRQKARKCSFQSGMTMAMYEECREQCYPPGTGLE